MRIRLFVVDVDALSMCWVFEEKYFAVAVIRGRATLGYMKKHHHHRLRNDASEKDVLLFQI